MEDDPSLEHDIEMFNIENSEISLNLFKHDISFRVLLEFFRVSVPSAGFSSKIYPLMKQLQLSSNWMHLWPIRLPVFKWMDTKRLTDTAKSRAMKHSQCAFAQLTQKVRNMLKISTKWIPKSAICPQTHHKIGS